ncbi:MAG: ATP synthase F1 subunit delta [Zetaproteobacteria bacterium]|nr:ATP synthase F1 subunit delta [Zetaproteobacteria bacterium]
MGRKNPLVTLRYAKALLRLCEGQSVDAEGVYASLHQASQIFEIDQAQKALASPAMPEKIKRELIEFALSKASVKETMVHNFCFFLIQRQRISYLPEICVQLQQLLDVKHGRVQVTLELAAEVDDCTLVQIQGELESFFEKRVVLHKKIEPGILGGFVATAGSTQLDCSVAKKLKGLTQLSNW